MKSFAPAALLSLLSLVACVKTGSVHERQPIGSVAAYKTATVNITAMPADLHDADDRKGELKRALTERLQNEHVFANVVAEGGDVVLDIAVTKVDGGNGAMRAFAGNAGSAEIAATVSLHDKAGKALGAFDVQGNSKKQTSVSVGGINTQAMEDATGKAIDATADQITEFLATKAK